MTFPVKIGSAVLLALLSASAARAECTSPGFNPTSSWCNGCTYEGSMTVQRDQPCERPYRPARTSAPIEFLDNRVTQRAKHGVAGVEGNTFAYAPAKGYVGPDDFTVQMNYRLGKEVGKFHVHFAVTVQ
ncbi:MAG: hypothetical protein J0I29_12010 [Rhizobiales bacterium]|nr:hypothetical protein [Hyphomicrobiales bacterium]